MVDVVGDGAKARPQEVAIDEGFFPAIRRRLVATRYVLIAAVGVLLVLAVSGRVELPLALGLSAIVAAVAALSPTRTALARRMAIATSKPTVNYDVVNAVLDSLADPLIILDERGHVTFANDAAHETVGKLPMGKSALLRFRSPELQEIIQEALAGAKPPPADFHERGPKERFFTVSIVGLPERSGADYRYALRFVDASEAKAMEKMRSAFIANASHELRTPLASLTGYVETLAGAARDDEAARTRFLPIMLEQTERMSRLVNDLLHLSKFETARGVDDFGAVDLADVLVHVADALKPIAESYGIEIDMQLGDTSGAPSQVSGDREELIQLFENLVENALKYAGDGKYVGITVKSDRLDGVPVWRVSVIDRGPGIPSEHLPRLTERFYRVSVDESRNRRGTGLGLAIAKHVVTRHDGRLQIQSKIGKGTTFSALLPKRKSVVSD
ncbi:MAG: ATP-binding protein [Pseudomonadota bacterium]